MKKNVILLILMLFLVSMLLIGCQKNVRQEMPDHTDKMVDDTTMAVPAEGNEDVEEMVVKDDETLDDEEMGDTESTVREIRITARNWEFVPNIIEVNEGDEVQLTVFVESGNHGLSIPDFGVSASLNQGDTVTVNFVADKTGEHKFFCNKPCGRGHSDMKGKIIVN